jgi:hypothetical protein
LIAFLAGQDGLFQQVFAASDPDLLVINLDDVDEGLHVGFSEWYRPGGEVLAHCAAKTFDQFRTDLNLRCMLFLEALQSDFGTISIRFERVESVGQNLVDVRQPFFDEPVKPTQLVPCIGYLPLQCDQARIETL